MLPFRAGVPKIRKHENGGGEGEAKGEESEDEDQNVDAAELLHVDGGLERRLDSRPRRRGVEADVQKHRLR